MAASAQRIDSAIRHDLRLFELVVYSVAGFALVASALLWLAGLSAAPITGMLISGALAAVLLALIPLARRGHLRLARSLFAGLFFICVVVVVVVYGGTQSPNAMGLGIAVLLAGLLCGWRQATLFGALAIAALFGLSAFEQVGLAPLVPVVDDPRARIILISAYVAATTLYLGLALRESALAREEAERSAALAAERERQLIEAQRLESLGRLAGGVAHDFGNLLTVILGNAVTLEQDPATSAVGRTLAHQIQEAGERAAGMSRQLLAFARRQVSEPRVVDLSSVVGEMQPLLARLLREDVNLQFHRASPVLAIRADPAQLEQILVNLVLNAVDAMPSGGAITVETSTAHLDPVYAAAHAGVAPGDYAALAVTDTGTGMDAATKAKVFEPFFSTKAGPHSGMGLATVHGIVKQAHGHIHVYSEVGRGTSFKVYLPLADQPVTEQPLPLQRPRAPAGGVTVLVVDDEPLLRQTAALILEQRGYLVLAAGSGAEAIARAAAHSGRIDVLITDVIMPEMNGRTIARCLRQVRQDLRVLYVSGYTENAIVHGGELETGINFLGKPFMPSALLDKLDQVLQGPVGNV